MKQYLHFLDYAIWIAVATMQWMVAIISLRKGLARSFPAFVAFISFVTIQSIVLLGISQFSAYQVYFWGFYFGAVLETGILFFVLYDVFRNVFDPLSSLPPRTIAKTVAGVAIITAVSITLAVWKPAVRPDALAALARTFQRTTNFLISVSFWSLVFYARKLGIPWRSRTAGIASGFLFYLTIQSITTAALGFAPQPWFGTLSRLGILSYLASLFVWLFAVQQQEVQAELPTPEALVQLGAAVKQMRNAAGKLAVEGKTKWIAE